MMNNLLTGWSWVRFAYLLLGASVMFQSFAEQRWWGFGAGLILLAMGVFKLGCAGQCAVPPVADENTVKKAGDVDYEEL